MALAKEAIDEVKALIATSRKRSVNFGLSLGKQPEDCGLVMHRIKASEALFRQARKMDGVVPNKSTFGTVETKGKTITFTCNVKPPSTSAKMMRQFFRTLSLPMKVVMISPDGTIEMDGEDDGAPTDDIEALDPNAQKWTDAKQRAEPQILSFLSAGKGDVSKVRAAWGYACSNADEGDYIGALKVLARLLPLLKSTRPGGGEQTTSAPKDTEDLREAIKGLLQSIPVDVASLKKEGNKAASEIENRLSAGIAAAKAGDLKQALALLTGCTDMIAEARKTARQADAQASVAKGTVAATARVFEANITRWRTDRLRSIQGLGALMTTLRREDDKELHDIASRINVITKDLPEALEDALSQLDDAIERNDQDAVSRAKSTAQALTAEAAKFLSTNSHELKLCEDNPFGVSIEIVAPLAESLKSIAASIKRL